MIKQTAAFLIALAAAMPAFAGHLDQAAVMGVPVIGEIGLVGFAIGAGLVGGWGIRKFRK